jgi:hypothetical protein
MRMRHLGAVMVAAEQAEKTAGEFAMRANPFLLHILVSPTLQVGDAEAKQMAGEIIGTSKWEEAIIAMPNGQHALLPSPKAGVYLAVGRLDGAAALVIADFLPACEVDWSKS